MESICILLKAQSILDIMGDGARAGFAVQFAITFIGPHLFSASGTYFEAVAVHPLVDVEQCATTVIAQSEDLTDGVCGNGARHQS